MSFFYNLTPLCKLHVISCDSLTSYFNSGATHNAFWCCLGSFATFLAHHVFSSVIWFKGTVQIKELFCSPNPCNWKSCTSMLEEFMLGAMYDGGWSTLCLCLACRQQISVGCICHRPKEGRDGAGLGCKDLLNPSSSCCSNANPITWSLCRYSEAGTKFVYSIYLHMEQCVQL